MLKSRENDENQKIQGSPPDKGRAKNNNTVKYPPLTHQSIAPIDKFKSFYSGDPSLHRS